MGGFSSGPRILRTPGRPETISVDATPGPSPVRQETTMLDGPLVFVDIDTQRDFLEPAGALFVPGSTEILANLARLTRFAQEHAIPILATACAHLPDDPELKTF